jgi:hydroxypyruvate reductase
MNNAREDALDIFLYALKASRVELAMQRRLHFSDGVMELDGRRYALREYGRCLVVAIGKAAHALVSSFLRQAGKDAERFEGIVVGADSTHVLPQTFRVYHGGHPSPNEASIAAAEDVLRTLESLTERDLVVFLISGGGSAMLEQFLQPDLSLEMIAATHKALVESGAPITAMNAVRKHLSAVKGGRLATAASPAEQVTLFVSDVPPGELDALSSGPTLPDRSTVADAYRIVDKYGMMERFPAPVVAMLRAGALAETPKPGDAIFARSYWSVLLDSTSLEEAAATRARELGWMVEIDNRCDDWSAEKASMYLVDCLRAMKGKKERTCLLSAGEVTVRVPPSATGRGGRNQHFALLCAEQIAGEGIVVLSGGSDGVDGNSPAAGAIVDGRTVELASYLPYSVADALAAFDSYSLLTQLEDTIVTEPTGNNLRDLRILLEE